METNNRKQLVTQDNGNIEKIFPKNYMSNIVDEETGESLRIFLLKYNHIDLGYRSSKSSARLAVPIIMRRKGLYITYYLPDDVVITEFFNGNKTEVSDTSWIKDELWVKDVNELNVYDVKISDGSITLDKLSEEVMQLISSKGDITINNFPDNEDLELYTIYQDSNNKIDAIRFKDRDNSNGMAYKYLRKTKNMILSQSDFNQGNTIYEIRYDFDLNGNTISIPDNCELKFEGGSLKNGTLVGNGTSFTEKIKFSEITFSGTFNQRIIETKWFTYNSSNDQELFNAIEAICDNNVINEVYFENKTYQLNISNKTEEDKFSDYGIVIPSNTTLYLAGIIKLNTNNLHSFGAFLLLNANNIQIKGYCTIIGDRDSHIYDSDTSEFGVGIKIFGCSNILVEGLTLDKWTGDGIAISNRDFFSDSVVVDNIVAKNCGRCGISVSNANNVLISNSKFINIGKGEHAYSVYSGIDIEPDEGYDGSGNNIKVINCIAENCQFSYKVDSSHVDSAKNIRFINCIADTKSAVSNVYDVIFDNCRLAVLLNLNGGNVRLNNCILGLINISKKGNYQLKNCTIDDALATDAATLINENALICSTIEDDFLLYIIGCTIKLDTIKLLTQKYKEGKINNYGSNILFSNNFIKHNEIFLGYGIYCNNTFEGNTFKISNITEASTILQDNVINISNTNNEIVFFKNGKEANRLQFLIISNTFNSLNNSRIRIVNTFTKEAIIRFVNNILGITTNDSFNNIENELLKGFSNDSIISSNIVVNNRLLTSKIIII